MAKRSPAEFHYVEWHFRRWLGSETRARCQAVGGLLGQAIKGVYRDLLDHCYESGTIPSDPAGLAAICGCSVDEMEMIWPHIEGKFRAHKKLKLRLTNDEVETRRREFERNLKKKSQGGRKSAEKRGLVTTNRISELINTCSTPVKEVFNYEEQNRTANNRTEKNSEEKSARAAIADVDPPALIADAIGAYTSRPDELFCVQLLQTAISLDGGMTPELLVLVIHAVALADEPVRTPGFFLRPIPELLKDPEAWKYLRRFYESGGALQAISDAQGVLRDRRAPERMRRFLSAWLASVEPQAVSA